VLARIYEQVLEACGLIAAVLVLAMTALIVADVLLRNLHDTSVFLLRDLMRALPPTIPASVELTEYMLFYATTFAAPWLLKRGQHIRIDVVISRVRPIAGWTMELAADLIGLALSLLMTWYGFAMVLKSAGVSLLELKRVGDPTLVVKNLIFSEWYVLWPLPVMFLLLAIEFVFRLQRLIAGPRRARQEGGAV